MWKQVRNFNLSKMGTKPGYCLQNVRLAFDIPPKYVDAKEAMEANRNAGTLHDISTLPDSLAVPVFVDTPSVNEHIEVSDSKTFYSDGKKLDNPMSQKFFGWGETLNGVRIVEWIDDPVPVPPDPEPEPKEEPIKEGDIVVPIQLIDYNGTPLRQYDDTYVVTQLIGDRAVLSANRNGQLIVWAAMNVNNIRKV